MNSISLVLLGIGLGLLLYWIFRRVGGSSRHQQVTAQWIEELSLDRYRP